jgi:hypothetical protein
VNNLIRWKYIQGVAFGIDLSTCGNLYRGNVALGNYVADSYTFGLRAWSAYGNGIHRWSEGNDPDGHANRYGLFALVAEGNFLDGAGSLRASQGMLLQDSGATNALRALLEAEVERGPDFLRLANALSRLTREALAFRHFT